MYVIVNIKRRIYTKFIHSSLELPKFHMLIPKQSSVPARKVIICTFLLAAMLLCLLAAMLVGCLWTKGKLYLDDINNFL